MIYIVSALIIALVSAFLILHCQYEDGIIGRLALIALAFSNGLIVADWYVSGSEYNVLPNTILSQCGMAAFLMRHVYRFLRWRRSGDYQWRPAHK
jgi:hypothetical protein